MLILFYAGVWEQWDTIAFPKEIKRGVRDAQDASIVSQFQTFSEGSENTCQQITINPENQELVVARCLGVYLNGYQTKLQSFDAVSVISRMVYNVEQVFNQLKYRLIGHESRTGDNPYYASKDWSSQKLNSVRFSIITLCIHTLFHTGYGALGNGYCP